MYKRIFGLTLAIVFAAAGCQLVFLPSYSPDVNPLAQAFATIKQALDPKGILNPGRVVVP